jgi:hypothetical protein
VTAPAVETGQVYEPPPEPIVRPEWWIAGGG